MLTGASRRLWAASHPSGRRTGLPSASRSTRPRARWALSAYLFLETSRPLSSRVWVGRVSRFRLIRQGGIGSVAWLEGTTNLFWSACRFSVARADTNTVRILGISPFCEYRTRAQWNGNVCWNTVHPRTVYLSTITCALHGDVLECRKGS